MLKVVTAVWHSSTLFFYTFILCPPKKGKKLFVFFQWIVTNIHNGLLILICWEGFQQRRHQVRRTCDLGQSQVLEHPCPRVVILIQTTMLDSVRCCTSGQRTFEKIQSIWCRSRDQKSLAERTLSRFRLQPMRTQIKRLYRVACVAVTWTKLVCSYSSSQ